MSTPDADGGAPITLPAALAVFGAPPRAVLVTVGTRSLAGRLARAGAWVAGCWVAAAASVLIPLAHFLLVPGFAILGPVMAVRVLLAGRLVERVDGACPRCGVEQVFRPGGPLRDERTLDCPRCHNTLTLRLRAPDPEETGSGGDSLGGSTSERQ